MLLKSRSADGRSHPQTVKFDRRSLLAAGAASLMLAGKAWAQQVPIPQTAAQVPGPAPGTNLTTPYVQTVARAAYLWGWALVNNANRHAVFSKVPEPGLLGGVVPVAHNAVTMLTDYAPADQHFIVCANQDVVYGFGFLDNLDSEPIVFQVPDFGDRFWVYALYVRVPTNSRTSAGNTARSPVSTWWSARIGRARHQRELRRCCDRPRRWSLPSPAFSWTTRRRITPPSSRCSVRSSSTRSRASTGK